MDIIEWALESVDEDEDDEDEDGIGADAVSALDELAASRRDRLAELIDAVARPVP